MHHGLVAMPKALDAGEDGTVSTDSVIELAECVLKNNIFEHNISFYKQLRGTVIRIGMAPPYAITYKGDLDEKVLKDCDKRPLSCWRYIDNIFMLRGHVEKELEKFLEFLNCYHPTIKFVGNYSREKKNNQLVTDLYVKPTEAHQYLNGSSCHVYHSKKSILYSQALHITLK